LHGFNGNFLCSNVHLENYDFIEVIEKYNLKDYIIMIIFKKNQEIKILNKINFSETMDVKNLKFNNLNLNKNDELEKLIKNLKIIYENYWKSKNEINTSVKLSFTVSINNSDNSEIYKFENTFIRCVDVHDMKNQRRTFLSLYVRISIGTF